MPFVLLEFIGDAPLAWPRSAYGLLFAVSLTVGAVFWSRTAGRDFRLVLIFGATLGGAFIGGKLVYLLAEGWLYWGHPQMLKIWMTGKTITGALLGGYAGCELAKWLCGYTAATGDRFATIVPFSIILGRLGCLVNGCCNGIACPPAWWTVLDAQGVARWPSVPAEIGFNVAAILTFAILRRQHLQQGQHFHLYLIGYGLFRFAHEFVRETPKVLGPFSGYHAAALAILALGVIGYTRRRRQQLLGKGSAVGPSDDQCRRQIVPDDGGLANLLTAPGATEKSPSG